MTRVLLIILFLLALSFNATVLIAAEEDPYAPVVKKYYPQAQVLRSLINPHEQINDEGEIIRSKCIICHPVMPDVKKAKSIADVKIRFEDDPKQMCYRCHPQPMHPGGEWVGRALGRIGNPNHLVVPPPVILKNQELSLKETYTMLPLDPKTGKQFCATCHNPHERGVLIGRADTGADSQQRKRTLRLEGATVCQYCHRK
jgi:hypothetical protein